MAPERARRAVPAAALALLMWGAAPLLARADVAGAWWQPLAFSGERVMSVLAGGSSVIAVTSSGAWQSVDGGRTFARLDPTLHHANPSPPREWFLDAGHVMHVAGGRAAADPNAPYLGGAAALIAAPAALPGVVVAAGSDGHVWRRDAAGRWATSFIALPSGGLAPAPRVTALAAFDTPLTTAVYMATSGYGVLLSDDGGDDWIRADAGLPGNVNALAADAPLRSLFAATVSGLYVHRLQALPAPPVYRDTALLLRWLGIAAVSLAASVAGASLLLLALRRPRDAGSPDW